MFFGLGLPLMPDELQNKKVDDYLCHFEDLQDS